VIIMGPFTASFLTDLGIQRFGLETFRRLGFGMLYADWLKFEDWWMAPTLELFQGIDAMRMLSWRPWRESSRANNVKPMMDPKSHCNISASMAWFAGFCAVNIDEWELCQPVSWMRWTGSSRATNAKPMLDPEPKSMILYKTAWFVVFCSMVLHDWAPGFIITWLMVFVIAFCGIDFFMAFCDKTLEKIIPVLILCLDNVGIFTHCMGFYTIWIFLLIVIMKVEDALYCQPHWPDVRSHDIAFYVWRAFSRGTRGQPPIFVVILLMDHILPAWKCYFSDVLCRVHDLYARIADAVFKRPNILTRLHGGFHVFVCLMLCPLHCLVGPPLCETAAAFFLVLLLSYEMEANRDIPNDIHWNIVFQRPTGAVIAIIKLPETFDHCTGRVAETLGVRHEDLRFICGVRALTRNNFVVLCTQALLIDADLTVSVVVDDTSNHIPAGVVRLLGIARLQITTSLDALRLNPGVKRASLHVAWLLGGARLHMTTSLKTLQKKAGIGRAATRLAHLVRLARDVATTSHRHEYDGFQRTINDLAKVIQERDRQYVELRNQLQKYEEALNALHAKLYFEAARHETTMKHYAQEIESHLATEKERDALLAAKAADWKTPQDCAASPIGGFVRRIFKRAS